MRERLPTHSDRQLLPREMFDTQRFRPIRQLGCAFPRLEDSLGAALVRSRPQYIPAHRRRGRLSSPALRLAQDLHNRSTALRLPAPRRSEHASSFSWRLLLTPRISLLCGETRCLLTAHLGRDSGEFPSARQPRKPLAGTPRSAIRHRHPEGLSRPAIQGSWAAGIIHPSAHDARDPLRRPLA